VQLRWNDNSSAESGFEVQSKWQATDPFTTVSMTSSNVNHAKIGGIPAGRTHTFRVRAIGASSISWSNEFQSTSVTDFASLPETLYLFAYFSDQIRGLQLAWSRDGYLFNEVKRFKYYLAPSVGEQQLMRDPSVVRGPDGIFRLVWTTGWQGKTIGYASSPDLLTWSAQTAVPVMASFPNTVDTWAPEITYDSVLNRYLIAWASSMTGGTHRLYSTTTSNFTSFSSSQIFYDQGFGVIDGTWLKTGSTFTMLIKKETVGEYNLRLTTSSNLNGPYSTPSAPVTENDVEGGSAIQVGNEYLIYFDRYQAAGRGYGAVRSTDLSIWENINARVSFPEGARHGTVIAVPKAVIQTLYNAP